MLSAPCGQMTSSRGTVMEKENFLGQHKVFIKSVSVSLVTHLLGLSLFSVAEIRQKPLPSHLRFTLLAIPALWEKTGPLAETTSDLDRADTSLLALTALTQTAGAGSAPKLELFHKQLIWEEEPENMPASPTFSGLAYWTFRKKKRITPFSCVPLMTIQLFWHLKWLKISLPFRRGDVSTRSPGRGLNSPLPCGEEEFSTRNCPQLLPRRLDRLSTYPPASAWQLIPQGLSGT